MKILFVGGHGTLVAIVLAELRKADIPITYLQMQHRPELADVGAADPPHRQHRKKVAWLFQSIASMAFYEISLGKIFKGLNAKYLVLNLRITFDCFCAPRANPALNENEAERDNGATQNINQIMFTKHRNGN